MEMSTTDVLITGGCIVIFLAVVIYSTFFSKKGKLKNESMEEFAVGSRSLGYFVVLCTLIGIFLPASSYTGWFEMVMKDGLIGQYIVVYSIAAFFVMYLFTQRIWIWGKNFHLMTQPDFVQLRFQSKPLTTLSAVSGVLIEAPWCVMEFASLGWLIQAITGGAINKNVGILIIGGLVLAYVIYGGMKSVAITEVIKGVLVIGVVIIGTIVVVYKLFGGVGPMYQNLLAAVPERLTIAHGAGDYAYWNSIILTGTLGCFGWVSMFCRIYTAKNVKEVKKSASGGAVLVVLVSVLLYIMAMGASLIPGAEDAGQMAFFYVCKEAAGPIFLGLAGVLVLSAAMGFIAVIMSSHGVVISENVIRLFKPNMSESGRRKSSRWSILVYGIICMVIAMQDLPNLAQIAIVIYEGVVQIIPLILFGIFWPRANKWSCGIGYIVGLAVAIFLAINPLPIFGSWSGGCIGLVVNVIINVILAFAIKKPKYVDELFDVVKTYKEDGDGNQIDTPEHDQAMKVAEKYSLQ